MLVVIISLTLHESAHGWVAYRLGDPTAYHEGQASLDPIPHIRREPIGMIVAPIISILVLNWPIAWASVPVDPQYMIRNPRFSAMVSMAGPLANLVIATIAGIALHVGLAMGVFELKASTRLVSIITAPEHGPAHLAATLLSMFFIFNLVICLFNLLPLPPLDGSALPLFFLSEREVISYFSVVYSPMVQIIGILVAWQISPYVISPVILSAFRLVTGLG